MNKRIKIERMKCINCGHEFCSDYPYLPYDTEKKPMCDICGSRHIEHLGYVE